MAIPTNISSRSFVPDRLGNLFLNHLSFFFYCSLANCLISLNLKYWEGGVTAQISY